MGRKDHFMRSFIMYVKTEEKKNQLKIKKISI